MGDAPVVRLQMKEGSAPSCSFCRGVVDGTDGALTCEGCQAVYHPDCLGELGACATLGCPRPRAGPRPAPGAARRIRIEAVGRSRQGGPRVGSERDCTTCSATFTVEARTRFSPLCLACRKRSNRVGLAIVGLAFMGYLAYFLLLVLGGR